jgi:hypothetical protein
MNFINEESECGPIITSSFLHVSMLLSSIVRLRPVENLELPLDGDSRMTLWRSLLFTASRNMCQCILFKASVIYNCHFGSEILSGFQMKELS